LERSHFESLFANFKKFAKLEVDGLKLFQSSSLGLVR
jgi:hypothetical protein